MMSYRVEPNNSDLAKLESDLNRLPKAFDVIHQQYTLGLTLGWKSMIFETGAVDTMRYFFSVSAKSIAGGEDGAGTKAFIIDTSSNPTSGYSDIVERGRRPGGVIPFTGGKIHPGYPGRFPAGKSLDKQHSEDLLDRVGIRVLDRFLHG